MTIFHKRGGGGGGGGGAVSGCRASPKNETVSLSCLGEDALPLDISPRVQRSRRMVAMQRRVGAERKEERQTKTRGGGAIYIKKTQLLRTPTRPKPPR